jgi:hypothetical protein
MPSAASSAVQPLPLARVPEHQWDFFTRIKEALYESSTAPSGRAFVPLAVAGVHVFRVRASHARWLEEMASYHNFESVNKTLRDVVDHAKRLSDDTLDRVLYADADDLEMRRHQQQNGLDGEVMEELRASITRAHHAWLLAIANVYALTPDIALTRVLQYSMIGVDEEELFEMTVNLPKNTNDLYSDIGYVFRS